MIIRDSNLSVVSTAAFLKGKKMTPSAKKMTLARGKFVLVNTGGICGSRLYAGDDEKNALGRWPFKTDDWMFSDNSEELNKRRSRLEKYLKLKDQS